MRADAFIGPPLQDIDHVPPSNRTGVFFYNRKQKFVASIFRYFFPRKPCMQLCFACQTKDRLLQWQCSEDSLQGGMTMHDVAKNIKMLRKQCGLNQTQLAEKIHVTRQAISSWERGLSCPDLHTLMELSKIFNVEIDQIIYSPSGEQKKPKRVSPLSPKFVIASVLIYFLLFHFGGAYIAIPLFKKICGGGVSEEFIFLMDCPRLYGGFSFLKHRQKVPLL